MDDWELLGAYARDGSEAAFAELLGRHVDAVYSTALRLTRDPHLAEEITQRAFQLLARKAAMLARRGALIGWLHRATCLLAKETWRTERRRRERETAAHLMHANDSETADAWDQFSPLLDEAINELAEPDRAAILLRFFQRRPLREVGAALGVGEDAAKMRVARAVEKLRAFFTRRGVVYPAATIAAALGTHCLDAAPISVAPGILATLPAPVVATSLLAQALVFMAKLNAKTLILGGVALLGALVIGHRLAFPDDAANRSKLNSLTARESNESAPPAKYKPEDGVLDEKTLAALERLRAILHEPFGRGIPVERIRQAIAELGRHRRVATPMLMAELKASKGGSQVARHANDVRQRMHLEFSVYHALAELRTEASEALPELMGMFRRDQLAGLNDFLPKLFTAIHPGADLVPQIIEVLEAPKINSRKYIAELITQLITGNPGSEETYRPALAKLLSNPDAEIRLHAAVSLGQLPGNKEAAALPVLLDALKLPALRAAKPQDPPTDPASQVWDYPRWSKAREDLWRLIGISGLQGFGPAARDSVEKLEEVARLSDNPRLRDAALRAIATIDPDKAASSPEVGAAVAVWEKGRDLGERARGGFASFEELLEGLKYPGSAYDSATALGRLGEDARAAVPALEQVLRQAGEMDAPGGARFPAAQALKNLAPDRLVAALTSPPARNEAAQALGELGYREALPALVAAFEATPARNVERSLIEQAIQKIDPTYPPLTFDTGPGHRAWDQGPQSRELAQEIHNLFEASALNDIHLQGRATSRDIADYAEKLRPVSTNLHRLFINAMVEAHPALRATLLPKP